MLCSFQPKTEVSPRVGLIAPARDILGSNASSVEETLVFVQAYQAMQLMETLMTGQVNGGD